MVHTSTSAIAQLAMHYGLHDKFCLHCDLSLDLFKPVETAVELHVCCAEPWVMNYIACYPMSGRQSTRRTLLTALQQLYIERIISINHMDLFLQNGIYVWKQLGNMENDKQISGGAHFC